MLTGAARRDAASVGSLLIAAVPSSPIGAAVFLLALGAVCVGGAFWLEGSRGVGMFAVLFAFGVLWGVAMGGLPSDGCARQSQASMRLLYVFRGVLFGDSFRGSACWSSIQKNHCGAG